MLSLSLVKLSILLLYVQIFSVRGMILAAQATGVLIVGWALTTVLLGLFMCTPFAFNWDQSIAGGRCGDQVLSYLVTGALNLATDVIVLVLPLSYLWGLQLQLYKKVVLMATFSMGIL